jgi:ADP-ribosylglycohydrolase
LDCWYGDALGVPHEFHDPEEIPPLTEIEYAPPAGYRRAHAGTPPGTWSDDGATAIALLNSLLICGHFDAEDLGARLLAWRDQGRYAVDARVFDIGARLTAPSALSRGEPQRWRLARLRSAR